MRFFERPFIFLAPLFIAGLLLGDSFEWKYWMTFPILAFVGWSIYKIIRKKSGSTLFYVLTIGGFLVCGIISMRAEKTTYSISSSGDYIHSMIGEITEVDNSKRMWTRSIFTIRGVVEGDRIRPHHEKLVCYVNAPNLELHDKLFLRKRVFSIKNKNNPGGFHPQM